QLLQRPGGDRGEGPAEVHEAVVAIGELLQELLLGLAQDGRQLAGHRERLLDQQRVGGHVLGGLRDREVDTVPVGDRAPAGGDVDHRDLLGDRGALEAGGLDRAQVGGAQGGEGQEAGEGREQQRDPAVDQLGRRGAPTHPYCPPVVPLDVPPAAPASVEEESVEEVPEVESVDVPAVVAVEPESVELVVEVEPVELAPAPVAVVPSSALASLPAPPPGSGWALDGSLKR